MYIHAIFIVLISICIITLFDVHTKSNIQILQCSDLECTVRLKQLQLFIQILKYNWSVSLNYNDRKFAK